MSDAQAVHPKTIVITGAARGIGLATATLLASRGHRVLMADLDGELAVEEAKAIGNRASGFGLDVTDREAFRELLQRVDSEHGPIDVVVNNAGIASASVNILDQEPAITERTIDINLKGTMNGTIEAIALMAPRRRGHVVNVASLAGILGVPGLAAYAASKFGVVGFTESVRMEFADQGLKFACVMPGPVATGMMDGTASSPVVSMLTPEQMAAAIVEGIEAEKPRVALPRSSYLLARLSSIVSPGFAIKLGRWTKIDRIYTHITPGARDEYEQRIRR
ncbi:MAG: SDR family NAD(P)-dependent oxidoreductase [Solirubrobacterales bacterium]|nr:SDR family NAD(P)-dependent oxidoreductase [Solirubrobacterales bacterium]OJU95066.1 MAG: hypothetical protein BGO23_07465 [Solirubrobacterales bacterium 67-14]